MHHARQHAETRTRERRQRLAHEAARLMVEGGIRDYHQAKLKAASRLGIHDDASLPRNREIEDALREYQRLFVGEAHVTGLRRRREAALRAIRSSTRTTVPGSTPCASVRPPRIARRFLSIARTMRGRANG